MTVRLHGRATRKTHAEVMCSEGLPRLAEAGFVDPKFAGLSTGEDLGIFSFPTVRLTSTTLEFLDIRITPDNPTVWVRYNLFLFDGAVPSLEALANVDPLAILQRPATGTFFHPAPPRWSFLKGSRKPYAIKVRSDQSICRADAQKWVMRMVQDVKSIAKLRSTAMRSSGVYIVKLSEGALILGPLLPSDDPRLRSIIYPGLRA